MTPNLCSYTHDGLTHHFMSHDIESILQQCMGGRKRVNLCKMFGETDIAKAIVKAKAFIMDYFQEIADIMLNADSFNLPVCSNKFVPKMAKVMRRELKFFITDLPAEVYRIEYFGRQLKATFWCQYKTYFYLTGKNYTFKFNINQQRKLVESAKKGYQYFRI